MKFRSRKKPSQQVTKLDKKEYVDKSPQALISKKANLSSESEADLEDSTSIKSS